MQVPISQPGHPCEAVPGSPGALSTRDVGGSPAHPHTMSLPMPPALQSPEESRREEPSEGLRRAPSLQRWQYPSARDWGGMLGAMPGVMLSRVPNTRLAGSPRPQQAGRALPRGPWWWPTVGDRVAPAMQSQAAGTSPSAADPRAGLIGSSLCTSCIYFRAVAAAGCPPSPACPLPGLPPGFNVLPAKRCGAA